MIVGTFFPNRMEDVRLEECGGAGDGYSVRLEGVSTERGWNS